MVGGNWIGAFPNSTTDIAQAPLVMCNVSRYVGLVDSTPGRVDDRHVEWGWYFGFYQNVFVNLPSVLLGNGALLKQASMAHGCVHRYDDSRVSSTQGRAAVAFSVFRVGSPSSQPSCEAEQRAYFRSFSDTANNVFLACVIATSGTEGRWVVQLLDEKTGAPAAALPDAYLWAFSSELLPGGRTTLLVEGFSKPIPFNRSGVPEPRIRVLQLDSAPDWKLTEVGTVPAAGVPYTRERGYDTAPPPFAQHKTGNLSRLVTRPNAQARGLLDFQLVNGTWIGYSTAAGGLVVK